MPTTEAKYAAAAAAAAAAAVAAEDLDAANLVQIGGQYTVDIAAERHPLIFDGEVAHEGDYIWSGYANVLEDALKVAAKEIAAMRLVHRSSP